MEDNLNGDNLNEIRTQWKRTSMEDKLNGRQPQYEALIAKIAELCPAQPRFFNLKKKK